MNLANTSKAENCCLTSTGFRQDYDRRTIAQAVTVSKSTVAHTDCFTTLTTTARFKHCWGASAAIFKGKAVK